jgi:hypothetical protein
VYCGKIAYKWKHNFKERKTSIENVRLKITMER